MAQSSQGLEPPGNPGRFTVCVVVGGLVMAGVVALLLGRRWRRWRKVPRPVAGVVVVIALYVVSLVVFYIGFFGTTWFVDRYLTPVSLAATVAEAVLAILAVRWALGRSTTVRGVAVLAAVGLVCVVWTGRYAAGLHKYVDPEPIPTYQAHYALVRDLPGDSVVAAWQSGTLSYFRPTTINLGGKMNRDAVKASRSSTMLDYLRDSQVEYVVDWQVVTDWMAPQGFERCYEIVDSRTDAGLQTDLWRSRSAGSGSDQ